MITYLSRVLAYLTTASAHRGRTEVDRLVAAYREFTVEELRAELQTLRAGGGDAPNGTPSFLKRLLRRTEEAELHALAIAVCLFDRSPCDLPPGSTAYEEQRLAALHLVDGLNVQMDTGEGKTYAVAIASVALSVRYPHVLVLTANRYLAQRDVARNRSLYDVAGIATCVGIPRSFGGPTIVYTTLDEVAFEYLRRSYDQGGTMLGLYPLDAAVVIDEIDSVLTDQAKDYSIVRRIAQEAFPWDKVFAEVDTWSDTEYSQDPISGEVLLSEVAWRRARVLAETVKQPASIVLNALAAAVWAKSALRDRQYVIDQGAVKLVNQITGGTYIAATLETSALEHMHGVGTPSLSIPLARTNSIALLQRHPHVVGTSGTAVDEALYFYQQLNTGTAIVPPKFSRYAGPVTIYASPSRPVTTAAVHTRIADVSPRPVVVSTWSPDEAWAIYDALSHADDLASHTVEVVTSFDGDPDRDIFESAGAARRVTVITQGGSRGVDIRSPHRPLLIMLGQSVEPRLDRQVMGRVGRHGEPFEVEVYLDPESPLKVPKVSLALLSEPVELNALSRRGLRRTQREVWAFRLRNRYRASMLTDALSRIEHRRAAMFAAVGALDRPELQQDYARELAAGIEPPAPADDSEGRSSASDDPAAASTAVQIVGALERRCEADRPVTDFVTSLRRALELTGQRESSPPAARRIKPDDGSELRELQRWLEHAVLPALDSGEPGPARLGQLRRQLELLATRAYGAPGDPRFRGPARVAREVLLLENAAFLQEIDRRLMALRSTSAPHAYHRRAVHMAKELDAFGLANARHELVRALSLVDRPKELGSLFFAADHALAPEGRWPRDVPTEQPTAPPSDRQQSASVLPLDDAAVEACIAEFLDEHGEESVARADGRVLLLAASKPFLTAETPATAAHIREHTERYLASIAASGVPNAALRADERLIRSFLDHLHGRGLLKARLPPRRTGTRWLKSTSRYARTLSIGGLMAASANLLVVVLGLTWLNRLGSPRAPFDSAAEVLFFGWLVDIGPIVTAMTAVLLVVAAGKALGLIRTIEQLSTASFFLALTLTFAIYVHATLPDVLIATGMAVAISFWCLLYFLTLRLALTLTGVDVASVAAGVSVLGFLVVTASDREFWPVTPALLGFAVLLWPGPRVEVSTGSFGFVSGRVHTAEAQAHVRIPIDPRLCCLLGGAAVTVLVPRLGIRTAGLLLAVSSLAVFTLLAPRRLSLESVTRLLAARRVSSPLTAETLRRHLGRAQVRTVATMAVALTVGAAVPAVRGNLKAPLILALAWGGGYLLDGARSLMFGVVVAPTGPALLDESRPDETVWRLLTERLRRWRRSRYSWLVRSIVIALLLVRPLIWIADVSDVFDGLSALWRWLRDLF